MDNILDHVVVQGQSYDIVSPTAFGDYIETIGSACINPDGYAQGSTFLAKFGNEQFYYEATAAITQGSAISEGTNCKRTTVTGREAELALEIENLGETVDSLNQTLSNQVAKCEVLVLSTGSSTVNALPYTFTDVNIDADMVGVKMDLSNPSAQTGDWTVTTANNGTTGTAQITGTISGTTTITLYLMKSR